MAVPSDGAYSAFTRSLEGFRRRLSAEDLENFKLTTFESLGLAIKDIQIDQAHRRALRNLNKIKPFLRFLQDYARVIEQFVSAKPDFLAFIWGPIKLCLQIASRFEEAFDALLDAYARIGEALPIFSAIDDLYASHRHGHVQQILADVYEDILTFHKRAVVFFKQKAWKIAFQTTFHSFGDNFGDVVKNLERSKELLVQSASINQFREAQDTRIILIQGFEARMKHERLEQMTTTINWLSSISWNDEHEKIQEKRLEFPGTARWVFDTAPFCDWLRSYESCSPVFWLYGIPGAGKTFLFNSVIDEVNHRLPQVQFVYFYCKYNDPAKSNVKGIARSLLTQILALNPACLHYLYDKALSSGQRTLESKRLCTQILTKLAEYHDQLVIGIDGLDECEESEKRPALDMITSILKATEATKNVRFFLTSRKESVIERSFRSAIALEIRPHHLDRDIKSYLRVRTSELSEIFSVDAERQQWIITEVSQRSNGMFLLARLVIDNLVDQDCEEALEEELNNKILPQGIHEAYGRILIRMQKKDQASKTGERAKLALYLIVMAKQPVKTQDIQGALSVCTQERSIKFEQRRSLKPLEELLGPIVEVRPNNLVTLVHPTARDFLLQYHSNCYINPGAANFKLAELCTSYLTFNCFDPRLDAPGIKHSVEKADYAFQEYATLNWIYHLEALGGHEADSIRDDTSSLRQSLARLHQQYLQDNAKNSPILGEASEARTFDALEELKVWRRVYERVEVLHWGNGLQEPMPFLLRRLLEVRLVLEDLSLQAFKDSPILTEAYGRNLYKCPTIRCTRFLHGFATRHQRDEHLKGHERNHKCPEKDCDYSTLRFVSEGELTKHITLCHGKSPEEFIFPRVRPISKIKALKDAIDRDDALAIRDICDAQTVQTIGETGFLLRAVKKKSLNAAMVVMERLGTTSEVDHQDKTGQTALHEVVGNVDFEALLEKVLETDVDVQNRGICRETPLEKALRVGDFHALKRMISVKEVDLMKACSSDNSPFDSCVVKAAAAGRDDIIQIVLPIAAAHVPVPSMSTWVSAALNEAACHCHKSTVALILTLGRSLGMERHYKGSLQEILHNGLEATAKLLIERSVDLQVQGKSPKIELRKAAETGDNATVMKLLRDGADINHGSQTFPTALGAASSGNQLSTMQLLLDEGANIDARSGRWGTHLAAASSKGHRAAIQLLLDNGADLQSGIYSASHEGQDVAIEFLLEKGARVNDDGPCGDALNAACLKGHEATVKLLLKNHAGIYARGEIADFEFGGAWSIELEDYARLNIARYQEGPWTEQHKGLYSALCVACESGHRHLVQLLLELLEKGTGTEEQRLGKYSHALAQACQRRRGGLEVVQALLRSGADPDYKFPRALYNACSVGNQDIAQLLLEHGADVNGCGKNGSTALIAATSRGHDDIVKMLLKAGSDVDAESPLWIGTTLMHACYTRPSESLVQLFLEHGADVNKQARNSDAQYHSALSAACISKENMGIVRMLLENGADVNLGSGEALKVASSHQNSAIVQILLEYGAKEM